MATYRNALNELTDALEEDQISLGDNPEDGEQLNELAVMATVAAAAATAKTYAAGAAAFAAVWALAKEWRNNSSVDAQDRQKLKKLIQKLRRNLGAVSNNLRAVNTKGSVFSIQKQIQRSVRDMDAVMHSAAVGMADIKGFARPAPPEKKK